MKIGMLTGGGDCPGLNAVIRAVVRKGTFHYEDEFVGFMEGWRGLLEDKAMPLDLETVGGILPRGGTILRTSRTNPAKRPEGLQRCVENLKKYGGFIPGIRPGKKTAEYIDYVLTRITVVGGIYLAFVCLIPEYVIYRYSLPFALGGTSILFVVSVMMDTVAQIQSHLIAQQYEGLIKRARLRGARR